MAQLTYNTARIDDRTAVDIHKIIDDAMEKKDRAVIIYISAYGVNVNVSPYSDEPLRWIRIVDNIRPFECPSCGTNNSRPTAYCPECGEKLGKPKE